MAEELEEDYEIVRKWRQRGRIPERAWPSLIEKAARRERLITASMLLNLNGPLKQTRQREAQP